MKVLRAVRSMVRRLRWSRHYERSLNRRAEVEEELFRCARGQHPLPSRERCRELAIALGVPDSWKPPD